MGVIFGDVVILVWIGVQIIQLAILEQSPAIPQHGCTIASGDCRAQLGVVHPCPGHATVVDHQHPIVQGVFLASQNRCQTLSVKLVGNIGHAATSLS